MTRHFHILDARVSLSGPGGVIGPIASAYERFISAREDSVDYARVALRPGATPELEVAGRTTPLAPELDTTLQVYQAFLEAVLDRIESCVVLHAAALANSRGEAFLLSAPSGHGKSTLTLELLRRGYRFMSDDYAPLSLDDSRVRAYPRRVALRADESVSLSQTVRSALKEARAPRLLDKVLLDVGEVFGEDTVEPDPLPLRSVFLLTSGPLDRPLFASESWLLLGVRVESADELVGGLQRIEGIEIEEQRRTEALWYGRLRLRHDLLPTGPLCRLLESQAIVFMEKQWGDEPDFASTPEATPLRRRAVATHLLREMMNRRDAGRCLARFGGNPALLFMEVANALRDVSCWRVRVGKLEATADLVERLMAGEE